PYAAVIPDVLLERTANRTQRIPVDAKYKLYDDRKIEQGDIYQTFFYAWAYGDPDDIADAPAFILYPGDGRSTGTHLTARQSWGSRGASIRAIPVDVPALLSSIRSRSTITIPDMTEALFN